MNKPSLLISNALQKSVNRLSIPQTFNTKEVITAYENPTKSKEIG